MIAEEFQDLALKQAKFIESGGLKEESGYSQINTQAWESLRDINALRFITYDSQAGDHSRERAYIVGFMLEDEGRVFVDSLNLWSDKVAFLTLPDDGIEKFSSIAVTKDYDERRGGWFSFTGIPLYATDRVWKIVKKDLGLPLKFPTVKVSVFDPKWGRPAWSKNGLFKDVIEALNPRRHSETEID